MLLELITRWVVNCIISRSGIVRGCGGTANAQAARGRRPFAGSSLLSTTYHFLHCLPYFTSCNALPG